MGKKSRSYADAKIKEIFKNYDFNFRTFEKLVKNLFVWENLPNNIPSRFIENVLFSNGQGCFYKHPETGGLVFSRVSSVKLNMYEEPSVCIANNIIDGNTPLKNGSFAMVYNNSLRINSASEVDFFAGRITSIDETFEENLDQLKNPYIFICPEGQVQTVKKYIIANDSFQRVEYTLFDTKVIDHTKSLLECREIVRSDFFNYFGVESSPSAKKERLLVNEVESNNKATSIYKLDMYNQRLEGCKIANDMFGYNISVRINEDVEKIVDQIISETDIKEGDQ